MSKREQEDLKELIDRHLQGLTSREEEERLVNYFESFQDRRQWDAVLGEKAVVRDRILDNINKAIDTGENTSDATEQTGRVIPMFLKKYRKTVTYAAAASVALAVISVSVFNFNTQGIDFQINNPLSRSAGNSGIVPEEKVVLTLEDGTDVELGEGEEFSSEYAKAAGESLVYGSDDQVLASVEYNQITVPRGKTFHIKLSDSTDLWVNSDSKIKYPVTFPEGTDRVVELIYGEAYLKVSPSEKNEGRAFTLKTGEQELTVLGTAFNVKAYRGDYGIATTLVEGKIAVHVNEKQFYLEPSDHLVFNRKNKTTTMTKVDTYYHTSWINGVFSFDDMPLEELMKALSRWYGVQLVFEKQSLKAEQFSGVVRRSQQIEQIVDMLHASDDHISFTIKNDTIYVK